MFSLKTIWKLVFSTAFCCSVITVVAQQADKTILKGNEAYRKNDLAAAADLYRQALQQHPGDITASFNLGNVLARQNNMANAQQYYKDVAGNATDPALKQKAFYNRGVAFAKLKQYQDAITAFSEALKLDPEDNDARDNLQKAINDLKKQQGSSNAPKNKPDNQDKKNNSNKPVNQEMMEQKFNELRDKEKQLQRKLQKNNNAQQPDKDW